MTERVVIVTGAARGIGAAIARRLSADGWIVVAADLDGGGVTRLADEAAASDQIVRPFIVDVADERSMHDMVSAVIARFGRVDALVNNAGVAGLSAPSWQLPSGEWERVVATDPPEHATIARATDSSQKPRVRFNPRHPWRTGSR